MKELTMALNLTSAHNTASPPSMYWFVPLTSPNLLATKLPLTLHPKQQLPPSLYSLLFFFIFFYSTYNPLRVYMPIWMSLSIRM